MLPSRSTWPHNPGLRYISGESAVVARKWKHHRRKIHMNALPYSSSYTVARDLIMPVIMILIARHLHELVDVVIRF